LTSSNPSALTVNIGRDAFSVALGWIAEREPDGIRDFAYGFPDCLPWLREQLIRDLFLQAVFALQHVVKARQATAGAGCLNSAHRREGDLVCLVAQVGARLGGFGVLFRGEPAVAVCHPAAIGLGVRSWPGPFREFLCVLFPDGRRSGTALAHVCLAAAW